MLDDNHEQGTTRTRVTRAARSAPRLGALSEAGTTVTREQYSRWQTMRDALALAGTRAGSRVTP